MIHIPLNTEISMMACSFVAGFVFCALCFVAAIRRVVLK